MVVETAVVALVVAVVAALVVAAVVVVMVPRAVVAVSAGMILCSHFQKVRFSCIFKRRNGRPDVPTDRQRCEDSSKKWLTCLGFFFCPKIHTVGKFCNSLHSHDGKILEFVQLLRPVISKHI